MLPTRLLRNSPSPYWVARIPARHPLTVTTYLWRMRWRLLLLCGFLFALAVLFRGVGMNVLLPDAPDMFAYYAPVMPGHSVFELSTYPCERPSSMIYPSSGINVVCMIRSEDDVVERITISAQDSTIVQTTFHLQGVRVIDLISRWGRPDRVLQLPDKRYEFCWAQGIYAQTAPTPWFTSQVSIKFVSMALSFEVQSVGIKEADSKACPRF